MYESGAVKLALGDVLLDVHPGTDVAFRQEIAAVSTPNEECVFLGAVHQRAVACPDITHMLGCALGACGLQDLCCMTQDVGHGRGERVLKN